MTEDNFFKEKRDKSRSRSKIWNCSRSIIWLIAFENTMIVCKFVYSKQCDLLCLCRSIFFSTWALSASRSISQTYELLDLFEENVAKILQWFSAQHVKDRNCWRVNEITTYKALHHNKISSEIFQNDWGSADVFL